MGMGKGELMGNYGYRSSCLFSPGKVREDKGMWAGFGVVVGSAQVPFENRHI